MEKDTWPRSLVTFNQYLVTTVSWVSWQGMLQLNQKHIKGWKKGLDLELPVLVSECFGLPIKAKTLVVAKVIIMHT